MARQAIPGFKACKMVGFENEANHVCANDKRGTNIIMTCSEGDNNSYSFLSAVSFKYITCNCESNLETWKY